jgi:hypothetical protein
VADEEHNLNPESGVGDENGAEESAQRGDAPSATGGPSAARQEPVRSIADEVISPSPGGSAGRQTVRRQTAPGEGTGGDTGGGPTGAVEPEDISESSEMDGASGRGAAAKMAVLAFVGGFLVGLAAGRPLRG